MATTAMVACRVRIVSAFGSEALAGYTFAVRVIMFSILPSWGVSNAAATLVGQNLGAANPARAEKSVWKCAKLNLYFLGIISVIYFVISEKIILLFNGDEKVIHNSIIALRYICSGYIFLPTAW